MKNKLLIFIFMFFCIINIGSKIYANNICDELTIYIVTNKLKYQKGDTMEVAFDIPKYSSLYECILRIDYSDYIDPISQEDGYFYLDSHSIFDSFLTNDRSGSTIYQEACMNNLSGASSSFKNNLCKVSFNVLKDINSVDEVLNTDNIVIYLLNDQHEIIPYDIKYEVKLTGSFCNNIEVPVNTSNIDITKYFVVNNRDINTYQLFEEKKINTSILGNSIIQIGLYDLITGDYTTYSSIVNVIDNISPTLSKVDKVIIFDYEYQDNILQDIGFIKSNIKVSDNYSKEFTYDINYYDKNMEVIPINNVNNIFIQDQMIYISCKVLDDALNESEELLIPYYLVDTTAPIINVQGYIDILDIDIDKIEFEKYLNGIDNISSDISFSYTITDEEGKTSIESLKPGSKYFLKGYATDESGNSSDEFIININIVDTTSPIVYYEDSYELIDVDVLTTDFTSFITSSDNSCKKCNVSLRYFIDNEELTYEDFLNKVIKKEGMVLYTVSDLFENTTSCEVLIKVKDTTPPNIYININNNDTIRHISELIINVSDNIDENVSYEVYYDDLNELIDLNEGIHKLKVVSVDASLNESVEELVFNISSNYRSGTLLTRIINKGGSNIYLLVLGVVTVVIFFINLFVKGKETKNKSKQSI